MKPSFPSIHRFRRGLLCLALAVLGWEGGRWARRHFTAPDDAAARARASQETTVQEQREHLLRQPGGLARRLALFRLSERTPPGDMEALLRSESLTEGEAMRLVNRWAEHDSPAWWKWAMAEGRRYFIQTTFYSWVKRNPEAALDALRSAHANRIDEIARSALVDWLRDEDGVAATLTPHLDEFAALVSDDIWVGEPDEGILVRLLALPPGPARTKYLRGYGQAFIAQDWKKGFAWAAQLPEEDRQAVVADFATRALAPGSTVFYSRGYSSMEPPGLETVAWAQKWLIEEADAATRSELKHDCVRSLGATDPAAAVALARQWLGGLALSRAVVKIVSVQAEKDRAVAIALIEDLPPGRVRMKATHALMQKWLEQDHSAAVTWALAQGKHAMDQAGWEHTGWRWVAADKEGFKRFAHEHVDRLPPPLLNGALSLLIRWNPKQAFTWASSLPEKLREPARRHAFEKWSRDQSDAAARFLTANPDFPVSENAIATLVKRYFTREAEAAVDWAANLPAGARREAVVATLKEALQSEKDPARREAWLERLRRSTE